MQNNKEDRNSSDVQQVLERARIGTFEHELGNPLVRVSPLACELHGLPVRAEVPLDELVAQIHPEDRAQRQESFARALAAGPEGFYDLEYRVEPPGYSRWLQARGRVVYSDRDDRAPARVVGIISDVTHQKARERSLMSMEAMLDAIGGSTDALIYAKDSAGRLLYCNEALLRCVGRAREEVIGRSDADLLGDGPTTEILTANDAQVLREGRALVFTEHLESLGRRYLSTKTPIRDDTGRLVGVAGVSIDITELESTREALARSEERASMAAEAAEIGIYDWDPQTDRLVWSDALREQFGLDLAQEVTLEVALARVHPEDRERVADAIGRALDPAGDGRYNIEYRTVPLGGQPRWLHVLGRVRFQQTGGRRQAVRFSGVTVNITRQKELEQALRFQLDLTRNITDNATTAIFMMDERSRCTFMNPAAERMTGYSFDEVRGGVLHDFIHHHHPDGRPYPVHECPIDRALPEQFEVVAHEDMFVRRNGEFFPVVVNAQPIRKDGAAAGTVIEVRDVTVERETLQRLRELSANLAEADRRKDEFLATLAHELRNPLSPILTASTLITSGRLASQQLTTTAQVIQRQVTHMAKLLDDLLDVARITRGKLTVERRPALLNEVMDAAVETVRPLVDEKQHELCVFAPPGEVHLWLDPYRISQVLSNLLTNAARYTPQRGRIELQARVDGADLLVSVADNGIGLEPDELARVFQMFAQGRAGDGGGLGIGLALARALVQLHGGELSARSAGAGRGSSFELRLPGTVRAAAAAPAPQEPAPMAALRVLLADDNRDAVDSLALVLQVQGHEVRVAYSGAEALRCAGEFRPQAIVLDIGMPDMTGHEVARRLRQEPWAHDTLMIALTGWGQQSDKELARQAGFDLHLTKPTNPADLVAALARLTASSAAPRGR